MKDKCVIAIKKQLPNLSDKIAEELAKEVESRLIVAGRKGEDLDDAMRETVQNIGDRLERQAAIRKRNAAKDYLVIKRIEDYALNTWAGDEAIGIEAYLGGVNSTKLNSRLSVDSAQRAMVNQYIGGFISKLIKDDLVKILSSKKFEKDLFIAAEKLARNEDVSNILPEVVQTAKIINEVTEAARKDLNKAGADIGKLEGRLVKQTHDGGKIRAAGKTQWVKEIDEQIDWDITMPDLDPAERMATLERMYSDFSTEQHLQYDGPPQGSLRGVKNVAKSMGRSRVIHFKSAEAAYAYHKKFGTGTVADVVAGGLMRAGENVGLMRRLGPNAKENLTKALDNIDRVLRERGDEKSRNALKAKREWALEKMMPNLDGSARIVGNRIGAVVGAGFRFSQITSKLGLAGFSALSDIPIFASEVSYQGGSFFGGLGQAAKGLTREKFSAEELEALSEMGVIAQGIAEGISPRYDISANDPGQFQKLTAIFMKLNALQFITDRLRMSFAVGASHRLGLNASKSYADLNPDLSRVLGLFGIDEGKWGLLSKAAGKEIDGNIYITAESIAKIDDANFIAYLKSQGTQPTARKIAEVKEELQDQLKSYYQDRSTHASLETDAKTRSWMLGGARPGTFAGEALRAIMLFKSFPVAILQKVVGRELMGRSETRDAMGIAKNLLTNGNGEMAGMAKLIVGTTIAGYISLTIKDLVKGKTPRDLQEKPGEILVASMLQGGALGLFGDFFFADMRNRYGNGPVTTILGPAASVTESFVDLFHQAIRGDNVNTELLKILKNNTPGGNLPFVGLALNHFVFWDLSNQISPGYMSRMQSRMQSEYGQELWIPGR
jgi:hypothetical protein